jgi:hypothetical protein
MACVPVAEFISNSLDVAVKDSNALCHVEAIVLVRGCGSDVVGCDGAVGTTCGDYFVDLLWCWVMFVLGRGIRSF